MHEHDAAKWTVKSTVAKWTPDQVATLGVELGREPTADDLARRHEPELVRVDGNLLLTSGVTLIMNRLISNSQQPADNGHTRLGVGNNNNTTTLNEAVGQTDLVAPPGSANRWFMTMDAGYPSVLNGVLTARATFIAPDANFTWNEWCLDVTSGAASASAVVGATMLNRKVAAYGAKVNGAVWQFTVSITLA